MSNNIEHTMQFDLSKNKEALTKTILTEVYNSLQEKGYNPINQIVGYIISGDLGYISSYKEARNRIAKIDRTTLVEELLKNYLKWDI